MGLETATTLSPKLKHTFLFYKPILVLQNQKRTRHSITKSAFLFGQHNLIESRFFYWNAGSIVFVIVWCWPIGAVPNCSRCSIRAIQSNGLRYIGTPAWLAMPLETISNTNWWLLQLIELMFSSLLRQTTVTTKNHVQTWQMDGSFAWVHPIWPPICAFTDSCMIWERRNPHVLHR